MTPETPYTPPALSDLIETVTGPDGKVYPVCPRIIDHAPQPPTFDPTRTRLESIAATRSKNHAGVTLPDQRAYLVVDPEDRDPNRVARWLAWADVARHVLEYLDHLDTEKDPGPMIATGSAPSKGPTQ